MQEMRDCFVDGHILVSLAGRNMLIDTGSPVTIGEVPDLLLGTDGLSRYDLEIDPAERVVRVGADLEPRGDMLSIELVMGVPQVEVRLDGRDAMAFFDTGAKLSYVEEELVNAREPVDRRSDFYPLLRPFEADIYRVPLGIGPHEWTVEAGTLPETLEVMLTMTDTQAVVGTQILDRFRMGLSFSRREMWLDQLGE